MAQDKPRVLITGGVGFIGRNFVEYLVTNNLASKIRVVDKVPPSTGWLNAKHKDIFEKHVDFCQANLSNPSSCERVFKDDQGGFDYVFNLAAETKYGQSDEVYKELVYDVTVNCSKQAAATGVKRYIELSTAQVYDSDKGISNEDSKIDPWTLLAKHKFNAEKFLPSVPGLKYVILRPAIVYGVGDKIGITPRLIIGAVYRQMKEKMQLLWTKDLRMNTVHVRDVCRALWHVKDESVTPDIVYNVVDKSNSTQGTISELVGGLFGIKHGYYGSVLSNLARLNMSDAVDTSNEKHLGPWSDACRESDVTNTPLTPYIDQELLYNRHLNIDGAKLESTGFTFELPVVTAELLKEVVDDYVVSGLFPASLAIQ
jgi:nucleoside-diphosphate-sugar epimerase